MVAKRFDLDRQNNIYALGGSSKPQKLVEHKGSQSQKLVGLLLSHIRTKPSSSSKKPLCKNLWGQKRGAYSAGGGGGRATVKETSCPSTRAVITC